jgi:hypothetical protein
MKVNKDFESLKEEINKTKLRAFGKMLCLAKMSELERRIAGYKSIENALLLIVHETNIKIDRLKRDFVDKYSNWPRSSTG